jgi:L,D-transpeptidase ErfK/SrfK
MQGPDVTEVQQKLRAKGFYWGALDGIYGPATEDAVRRFQLVRGIRPTGGVGPETWTQLGIDPPPTGRAGYEIVIDLSSRRLYLRQNGRTVRSFPVGIGRPETPTPLGRWLIVQKAMNPGGVFGARWMRLSVPWGGFGIHGTNDPSSIGQVVSHGCIRMQDQDVIWLYDRVPLGTPVTVVGRSDVGSVLFPGRSSGDDVAQVQQQLTTLGLYAGPIDGVYGPATVEAVRRFQREQGLTPDGIVGPVTYDALQRAVDQQTGSVQP